MFVYAGDILSRKLLYLYASIHSAVPSGCGTIKHERKQCRVRVHLFTSQWVEALWGKIQKLRPSNFNDHRVTFSVIFYILCCFVVWFHKPPSVLCWVSTGEQKSTGKAPIYRACENVSCNNAKTTQQKLFYYLNCRHKRSNQLICIQCQASSSAHT